MNDVITRTRVALGAAALLAFLIVPVAFAGGSSDPTATASGLKGKVKKLTKRVNALEQALAAQQGDAGPPNGPAGGDLTGTYPNPLVAADAITSSKVAPDSLGSGDLGPNSVGTSEIAGDAVTSAKVGPNAVGSGDLATITAVPDPTPFDFGNQDEGNNDYVYGTSSATCPAGSTVVGGGFEWLGAGVGGGGGDELQAMRDSVQSGNGWFAQAASDVDNQDFRAVAYCLTTGA